MPHRKTFAALGALAALATLSACESIYDTPHPLDGTSWRLVEIETSGTSTSLTPELASRHRLTFEGSGDLRMQLDCNRGSANWSASQPRDFNGTITIGEVAATRALCPRPTFGEELAAELPDAVAYTLTPDGRGLVIRTNEFVYAFDRDR